MDIVLFFDFDFDGWIEQMGAADFWAFILVVGDGYRA